MSVELPAEILERIAALPSPPTIQDIWPIMMAAKMHFAYNPPQNLTTFTTEERLHLIATISAITSLLIMSGIEIDVPLPNSESFFSIAVLPAKSLGPDILGEIKKLVALLPKTPGGVS